MEVGGQNDMFPTPILPLGHPPPPPRPRSDASEGRIHFLFVELSVHALFS